MSVAERTAVDWLLESSEPAIRYLARRDLLDDDAEDDADAVLVELMPLPELAGAALEVEPESLEEPLPPLSEPDAFGVGGVAAEDLPRLSVR